MRYIDDTVKHWYQPERPDVDRENGQAAQLALAVIDVPTKQRTGDHGHGSQVSVRSFEGAALDRDRHNADKLMKRKNCHSLFLTVSELFTKVNQS